MSLFFINQSQPPLVSLSDEVKFGTPLYSKKQILSFYHNKFKIGCRIS